MLQIPLLERVVYKPPESADAVVHTPDRLVDITRSTWGPPIDSQPCFYLQKTTTL